ncbi:MAG: hypothetical protein A2V52_02875 [Actinobacteria bacterium RBG_19FT_COMBO_54_7]|uniref:Mannose-6-phosphate isomerase type II C-terminal domain-containing protein n=1 Tax=Candidatus Solincola sediminis TaxID=1797199 RepID=A0A1F2WRV3_9ACTN|nr:MAG: hypothetical protein A2Y75_01235 [Candidatus Solincola sediminis]OFW60954.1 MAG: hypothetical protein A2W01_12340 [Candidatus Solincola sediminis]OFW70716.1 MAG: hypothetical protein A2V52_02875 [Actinobacteria bacterium RBG_19FT_COMBO_54_7]
MNLEKPWGSIKAYVINQPCTVKIISINEGQETSLHYHKLRDEMWIALDGGLEITVGGNISIGEAGTEYLVTAGELHRIRSIGQRGRVLEIDMGFTSEDDNYRIKDEYGRKLEEREDEAL